MRNTLVGMDSPARLRIVFAEIHGSSTEVSSAFEMIGKALGVEPGPALAPPPPTPTIESALAPKQIASAKPPAKRGRPAATPAKPAVSAPAAPPPATPKPPKIQSPLTAMLLRELRQGPKRMDFLQSCAEDECPNQSEHLAKAVASLRRNGHIEDIEGGFKLAKPI